MFDLYRYYRTQTGFAIFISLFLTFGTSPLMQNASAGETDWNEELAPSISSVSELPAPNDPPVAEADTFATPEDSTLVVGAPGVLANDSDPDDDTLTATLVDSAAHGAITLNDDGSFEYTPDSGFVGTDQLTYEARDSSAADTASVTVEVTAQNTAPTVAVSLPDDTLETPGPPLQLTSLGETAFNDPDGDTLSFSAGSSAPSVVRELDQSPRVVILKPQNTGNAQITVTASDGQSSVTDTFEVIVERRPDGEAVPSEQAKALLDSTGADSSAVDFGTTGASASFAGVDTSGSVTASFFPESAGSDTSETPGGVADSFDTVSRYAWQFKNTGASFDSVDVTFSLSDTSVSSIDRPDSLKVIRDAGSDGTYDQVLPTEYKNRGTPSDSSDDVLVAKGIPGFSTFKFASGSGSAAQAPPTAKADTFSTPTDSLLSVAAPGVLANDSDPDGDTLTATLVDSTAHGAITLNDDGSFEYTPDSGFTGTDGFAYEAIDDSSASDTASVRIEVVPPNSPPTVAVSLPTDTMKVPGPPLQLTNLGQSVFTDPDGDTLSFEAASSNPSAVQVLDQSPRVVILKPQQAGTAEITITASDGQADTSDTFTAVVEQRSSTEPVPSAQAKAVLDTTGAEQAAVGFGTTGAGAVFEGVDTQGSIEVSFFPDIGSDTSGTQSKTTEVDTFENVSTYAWQFDNQGTSFDSVDVAFALGDTSVTGVENPETVRILRDADDDGTYDQVLSTRYSDGGTPSDSTDDVLIGEGIPGFSTFKLASNDSGNSLPVELASFDAEVHGEETYLNWRTASERSNAGFQVQRKTGSQDDWTKVGFVASKASGGTTTESQTYRFRDADLPYESDRLTYRLKQVDTDGSSSFSKTITVRRGVDKVALRETYPNPAQTQATVRYALPEAQNAKLVLYNVLGQKVQTVMQAKQAGRHKRQIDVSGLPSGTYFLQLRADGETKTRRLTVVR